MRSPYTRAVLAISLFVMGADAGWNLQWGDQEPNAAFIALAICIAILIGGYITWSDD